MRLVYRDTGEEVKVGDIVNDMRVVSFDPPHKSSSSGKVYVKSVVVGWSQEFYVGVIGAEWIEREDR